MDDASGTGVRRGTIGGMTPTPTPSWFPPDLTLLDERPHWYDAGLPRPELQWWVYDDHGRAVYRLDIALPDVRFAAEYDGRRFHDDNDEQREHDDGRRGWLDRSRSWNIEVFDQDDVYAPRADPSPRLQGGVRMARSRSGLWVPESAYRTQS